MIRYESAALYQGELTFDWGRQTELHVWANVSIHDVGGGGTIQRFNCQTSFFFFSAPSSSTVAAHKVINSTLLACLKWKFIFTVYLGAIMNKTTVVRTTISLPIGSMCTWQKMTELDDSDLSFFSFSKTLTSCEVTDIHSEWSGFKMRCYDVCSYLKEFR